MIHARLDLVVRLIDTTTGATVEEANTQFYRDGVQVRPSYRGDGTWVFVNTGREDFLMRVQVFGYDPAEKKVVYADPEERLPVCDMFLMPSENSRKGASVLSVSGSLPSLEALDAVNLSRTVCGLHEYTEKKGVASISLFPAYPGVPVELEDIYYGLLSADGKSYERFEVLKQEGPQSVVLRAPLTGEHAANQRICRMIFGHVDAKEGRFSLKVRDDGKDLVHLVRFVADGSTYFRKLDFHAETSVIDLMEGAEKTGVLTGKEESDE